MFSVKAQVIKVIDKSTSLPLEGVTISTKDKMYIVSSDLYGEADITNLITHSADLSISFFGFQTIETTIQALDKTNPVVQLMPKPFDLDQVVVSASKWSQSSLYLPQKVSSLKAKDIAVQKTQPPADLLGF